VSDFKGRHFGGEIVLWAASTAPSFGRVGINAVHAAFRKASFLCSVRCCMFR
jgi:hypothetical protein